MIPIRKTSDVIPVPFHFPMMHCLKDYYPEEYNRVIEDVKLGEVPLDLLSAQQLCRLVGLDFAKMTHNELTNVILSVIEQQTDNELISHLNQIKSRLEGEIIKSFFQRIKNLPVKFLFPQLGIDDFKVEIENHSNFNSEQEYRIQRARARHNNSLKRVGGNLGIEGLSGHVPRHTLANHMAFSGNSEEEIRQVLGHSSVRTTKIYLRERIGFSGSYDIMKRFHQRSDDS